MIPLVTQVASRSLLVGSSVWVDDPEVSWVDGEVLKIKGDEVTIKCTSGKKVSFSCIQQAFIKET